MPVQQDFRLVVGEDATLIVGMAPPQPIGGWDLRFTITHRFGGSGVYSAYGNSGYNNVSGINITDSGLGVLSISIPRSATSGFDPKNYATSLERRNSGAYTAVTQGYLLLLPSVIT